MNPEIPQQEVLPTQSVLTRVTPLSKYMAMTLFILMPFVGGYIGYVYAPAKIVEVEKTVVVKEPVMLPSLTESPQVYRNDTLGFELRLPDYIQDHSAVSEGNNVTFSIDATNTDWQGDFNAFSITSISHQVWNDRELYVDERGQICSHLAPDDPCVLSYLGSNTMYHFGVGASNDCPSTGRGCELREYALGLSQTDSFSVFTPLRVGVE